MTGHALPLRFSAPLRFFLLSRVRHDLAEKSVQNVVPKWLAAVGPEPIGTSAAGRVVGGIVVEDHTRKPVWSLGTGWNIYGSDPVVKKISCGCE